MKAVVVGCGVGGPAVALYLRRIGWQAQILEAAAGTDPYAGAFLNVATNGLAVLTELGLADRLLSDAHPCPQMVMWSGRGRRLGAVPNGPTGEPERGSVVVRRAWLQEVLRDAAAGADVDIVFGARLAALREEPDGIVATTTDGRSFRADIAIGADGIGSAVRRHVDHHLDRGGGTHPVYSGLVGLGGYASGTGLAPTPGQQHFVFGRRSFFGYLVRDDGTVFWFANLTRPEEPRADLRAVPAQVWLEELAELHRDDAAPVPQIVAAADDTVGAYPIYDLTPPSTWHHGRAVLLGDAVHATSPSAGQGAALTLEDAETLARCLRDLDSAGLAFTTFTELRRERTEAIVGYARTINARKATSSSRIAMAVRDALLPIFLRRVARDTRLNWVYDWRSAWAEPVTDRLKSRTG